MERRNALRSLITRLQTAIANFGATASLVDESIKQLHSMGYAYDYEKFPPLAGTESFMDASGPVPANLAEALLWKLGKWNSYKRFAAYYTFPDSKPTKTDVVFFAFAQHLKKNDNPIYDQHALRAVWAVCQLTDDEARRCKSVLFDGKCRWKQTGSGSDTVECYELFVRRINDLAVKGGCARATIDHLLMPLGQAIKELTNSHHEFCELCGWRSD
ncbi:MAG TPA: hypothetical protein VLW48_00345 [Candidatus Bathyarchaeia archaeon]|nr:hypothetical protein [Candidatus Bathyarchaeia archaeon]